MSTGAEPHWLEMANWVAGVCVAIFAGLSLRQLSILKTDISTRNERAAKEKALEGARLWAEAQEGFRPFLENCQKAELPNIYGSHQRLLLPVSLR